MSIGPSLSDQLYNTTLRRRLDELERNQETEPLQAPVAPPSLLARTFAKNTYPTSAQSFYACHPVSVSGTVGEGQPVTLTQKTTTFYAANVGTDIPPVGSLVQCTKFGKAWAFNWFCCTSSGPIQTQCCSNPIPSKLTFQTDPAQYSGTLTYAGNVTNTSPPVAGASGTQIVFTPVQGGWYGSFNFQTQGFTTCPSPVDQGVTITTTATVLVQCLQGDDKNYYWTICFSVPLCSSVDGFLTLPKSGPALTPPFDFNQTGTSAATIMTGSCSPFSLETVATVGNPPILWPLKFIVKSS